MLLYSWVFSLATAERGHLQTPAFTTVVSTEWREVHTAGHAPFTRTALLSSIWK
jgi:hypothetical protein